MGDGWKAHLPSPSPWAAGSPPENGAPGAGAENLGANRSSSSLSQCPPMPCGHIGSSGCLVSEAMDVWQDRTSEAICTRFGKSSVTCNHPCAHPASVPLNLEAASS